MRWLRLRWINQLFPLWVVLLAAIAYVYPTGFVPLKAQITPLLVVIMFAMGLTLQPADFQRVAQRPRAIGIGLAAQYLAMPLIAWGLSRLAGLRPDLLSGMVLVGTCPGGTASNVIAYLAGADVALSISLTLLSTLLSVGATPLLTWLYAGQSVPVPVASMLLSIAQIVLLPVLLGALVNRLLPQRLQRWETGLATVAMAAIVLIIAIIVALNRDRLSMVGPLLIGLVALHNGLGLASGYGLARLLRLEERTARTIAIEVGMQNSGLAVALATQYFSAAAALPGAIFSVWHNLSGAVLASVWQRNPTPRSF